MKPVVIAGAGLSGLATGVLLSSRNIPVTLFEQKTYPGGRAYSFTDPRTGESIDNGQHIMIAGYESTLRLLDLLGTRHLLRIQNRPTLRFHHPERGFRKLRLPALPAPLHLAWGILVSDLVGIRERLRLLRAGMSILRSEASHIRALGHATVEEWLTRTGQSAETRRSLWEPLAIAIMNEECGTASALLFVRALRMAFVKRWGAASFAIPTVGLSDLFATPAVEFIRNHGGTVVLGTGVRETLEENGLITGVVLENGTTTEAGAAVLAVPPYRIRALLPESLRSTGFLCDVERIPVSPIVSLHLWFDRDFMGDEESLGIIGRRIQWLFNRRAITGADSGISRKLAGGYVCAVISAAHQMVSMSNEELVAVALADLRAVFGNSVADPIATLVIREKRATFSSSPASERLRPSQETPIRSLFVAGDWTSTGYPATIEGAVVCAERVASLCGKLFD